MASATKDSRIPQAFASQVVDFLGGLAKVHDNAYINIALSYVEGMRESQGDTVVMRDLGAGLYRYKNQIVSKDVGFFMDISNHAAEAGAGISQQMLETAIGSLGKLYREEATENTQVNIWKFLYVLIRLYERGTTMSSDEATRC